MRGHSREERSRLVFLKLRLGKSFRGSDRAESETRHRKWMSRHAERCEEIACESIPGSDERRKHATIRCAVFSESFRSRVERTIDDERGAIVEGMSECGRRVNEFESVLLQRQLRKERRSRAEWMNCGTDVVNESRQCEFRRSGATADG